MSREAIQPSTIEGVKRLAKSFKAERGMRHTQALDAAAEAAGFQNFRHARNVLRSTPNVGRPHSGHCIFLTSYWKNHDDGLSGRETLSIWLSVPWGDLITSLQLQNHRALANFRSEGPDHLARENLQSSQSAARRSVCAAARALHFMDATKLRPSKSRSRPFPRGRSSNAVPGRDHYSIWYDRQTKRYLFADEPYDKAVEGRVQEREAWAKEYGFAIVKPDWAGMYAPDVGSRLYLISDRTKGIPLGPVAAALSNLPSPIVEATWDGESAPMKPFFVSPGAIAKAEATKAKTKTPRKQSRQRNSVGYVQTFVGPQRRPKSPMPIEAHAQVGRLLKSVLKDTYHRKGVYNRLNSIRSELDEWAQREYSHAELPNEQFFELYYRESDFPAPRALAESDREQHVQNLMLVKKLLCEHYPDCPPLRALLRKVDGGVRSLQSWN